MDEARAWTDAELEALEAKYRRAYGQAAREMRERAKEHLQVFERERAQRLKALDDTPEARKAYEGWLSDQTTQGAWLNRMADELAASATRTNQAAAAMLNDSLPHIFTENANRAAFDIERAIGHDVGFTLVNEDAVRYLMGLGEGDQLIKEVLDIGPAAKDVQSLRRSLDQAKDIRWNRQKFTAAITQGVLQGDSIPRIVKRTEEIYGRNRDAATRAARTATTNAENAGRARTFERAERLGIDMEIEWLATLDERTRHSHRLLDGERIHTGERFSNGLRWPGDPTGAPEEVWCCRCRANGRVVGFDGKRGSWADQVSDKRWSKLPKGMTYDEWKGIKELGRAAVAQGVDAATAGVVEGSDILGTWVRRPDEFDFEIEDVLNAQGFDGLPRVLDADEFDRAVKEANGGDGLIMQRTYSAPDRETLDTYRSMLYEGKWRVDCSTGGAQYGQGMYCAADYTGHLSDGVKEEMRHYIELGEDRAVPQVMSTKAKEIADMVDGVTPEQVDSFLRFRIHGEGKALGSVPFDKMAPLVDAYKKVEADVRSAGAGFHYVETMTLDPSARVITWVDAMKLQDKYWEPGMPGDIGSFAAAMGYDAINAAGHGASGSYTVVLNRTKLIIRRPE